METKTEIKAVFERFFEKNGVPYFLGGSMRFGWSNVLSDIDFFVYMNQVEPAFLQLNWLPHTENKMGAYLDSVDYQYSFLGGLVHISGFDRGSLQRFERLRCEHEKVEEFLCENKKIAEMLREIKQVSNINGSIIYRAILKNMLH